MEFSISLQSERLSLKEERVNDGEDSGGADYGFRGRGLWEGKLVQPLWESERRILKKNLETELPHDPATVLLGVRLKESKSVHHGESLSTTGEKLSTLPRGKASLMSTNYIQIQQVFYLAVKKNEVMLLPGKWMELEVIAWRFGHSNTVFSPKFRISNLIFDF